MYIHICQYGDPPIPDENKKERSEKLKKETRDFIVPIRMNFEEKEKIKIRAIKTGKSISTFMRDSSLRL